MPYRLFVPPTWDGKASLPIILMLHGGGANENTYMDMSDGLLPKLAAQHGYIVVSPLGFTALGRIRQSVAAAGGVWRERRGRARSAPR